MNHTSNRRRPQNMNNQQCIFEKYYFFISFIVVFDFCFFDEKTRNF